MTDPRIKKLAEILVNYSVKIKKGDTVRIGSDSEAKPLILEIYKLVIQKGAFPILNIGLEGTPYIYYKYASEEQLKRFPKLALHEVKNSDAFISIGAEYNTKELTTVNPKKISIRRKITYPISKVVLAKDNWVGCEFPTNALAQDAEMSLQEFEDFMYNSTNIDWNKMSKKQDKLKKILDKGKTVRIVAKDTDLTFSIKGRKGIKCDGHRNMPDGEVFIAPVETTVEGHIKYTYPAIYGGREVDGIYLEFKKGAVVKATAEKGESFLKAMINTDKGSKYLGEFGIGLNPGITKFVKQILFDEKMIGTIHLALGMAYKEGGGKNDSAVHWDMIKDLRKGGAFYVDGKCIQKNGKFTFKL